MFSVDVENIVLECFAEFSRSAKNEASLKREFEASGEQYQKLIRHVITRWLTLFEGLARIIKSIEPIKSYFISRGEEHCHKAIWQLFGDQEDGLSSHAEPTLNEIKLYFVHSFLSDVHEALLALESEATLACHLSKILCGLTDKIENKRKDKFFGMIATFAKKKNYLDERKWKAFEIEALKVYDRFLLYLKRYFHEEKRDFFDKLSIFDLSSRPPTLNNMLNIFELESFKVGEPGHDLYAELKTLETLFPNLKGSTLEKWNLFFQSFGGKIEKSVLYKAILYNTRVKRLR